MVHVGYEEESHVQLSNKMAVLIWYFALHCKTTCNIMRDRVTLHEGI